MRKQSLCISLLIMAVFAFPLLGSGNHGEEAQERPSSNVQEEEVLFTCEEANPQTKSNIVIKVKAKSMEVLRSSVSGRFTPLKYKLEAMPYEPQFETPAIECHQSAGKERSIHIFIFKDFAQVLRTGPGRFAPVQYRIK